MAETHLRAAGAAGSAQMARRRRLYAGKPSRRRSSDSSGKKRRYGVVRHLREPSCIIGSGAGSNHPKTFMFLMEMGSCPLAQKCRPSRPSSKPTIFRPTVQSYPSGLAARGRRPFCCTVMAKPATCGLLWRRNLSATIRVVAPDLRGLGLSSRPDGGYDKKTQGRDVAGLLDALVIERVDLITHDIGNMVGYAFAAQYPAQVARFVLMN